MQVQTWSCQVRIRYHGAMSKSYGQWCALAKALDAVGERWSLLVVRELLDGPKRYTDLQDGIPGISTDVLATRLRDLEERDVVRRCMLPAPAASKVYVLTERGRDLAPVIGALTRWGMQSLGDPTDEEAFRPHWLALGLRSMLRTDPTTDIRLEVDFDLGSERVRIHIADGELAAIREPDSPPDVLVHAELGTLAALADGSIRAREAMAKGLLRLEGSRAALRTYVRLFSQPART